MAYVLAVLAAFANALTSILQRMGVETAPAEATLRLSLIAYAVRRKVWIAGFVVMIAAFLLQFLALHFGRLTTVQPILTLELPFLVAILGFWFRQTLTWKEWVGSSAAAGGLAAFLALSSPTGGNETPDLDSWGLVSFAVIAGGSVAVILARFGSPAWRAAWFGVAGAIAFAFTAALIKQTNDAITHGWAHVFLNWPPYAMAGMGIVGMFLAQNAFQAGPVTASQSALVIVDPLASIAIGIGLFGDHVQTAGGRLVGEVLAMVVLIAGVYSLSRSPLVVSVKSEDEGDGHLLGARPRRFGAGSARAGSARTGSARAGSARAGSARAGVEKGADRTGGPSSRMAGDGHGGTTSATAWEPG
ncbi:MAG TPA: DMT family transporter [Acidimicrobiales bacterium]|nr:DMT family transporter [Acidimicrobiales bacterium]